MESVSKSFGQKYLRGVVPPQKKRSLEMKGSVPKAERTVTPLGRELGGCVFHERDCVNSNSEKNEGTGSGKGKRRTAGCSFTTKTRR